MSNCIEWTGRRTTLGYGAIGKHGYAHREAAKVLSNYSDDLVVLHMCDNRACVNPEHLKMGTQADNVKDMLEKNRGRNGTGVFLTKEEVEDMKGFYALGWTQQQIADYFNIHFSTVSRRLNE